MNLDRINQLLTLYSVQSAESFSELPKTTSGNTSYVIPFENEGYVLRTLVRQSPNGATEERQLQQILNQNGVKTPLYLQTTLGDIVSTTGNGDDYVLSELILGSKQQEDTLELAFDMGATLATIHDTLGDRRISFNRQQWFNPKNTQYQLENYSGPEKEFISQNTMKYSSVLQSGLPLALTHGDFHTNNIFSENDKVTAIFDFESAEYTVRILDIARLYLTYIKVTTLEPHKVIDVICAGYNSRARLPLQEQEYVEFKNAFIYVALVSSVSIYNHGNKYSSEKYLSIAKSIMNNGS